jgi:hypothetical protein
MKISRYMRVALVIGLLSLENIRLHRAVAACAPISAGVS